MARNKAITIHKRISVAQDWLQCYAFDGFCSLVDTSNQAISILGLKQASVSDVTVVHGIQSILEPPKELTLSWAICITHPSEPKVSIGSVVEPEIENGIRELLLLARPSIDNVYAVQSQWVRPSTFSFKDVTRLVEKEVQEVEEAIRSIYPETAFIELEPDSKEPEMQAVFSMQTKSSCTSEREA
ncbi:hypothetical protein DD237_003549 [Peronospora effusa]|uniref:Uncharacterized protein n=1 Tax=Peronospora effusa TaxID=542832 RepID=A0A3R7XBI9_9STRA|nr:hypothetical protein DD237_003549 [Peronospora effusa]